MPAVTSLFGRESETLVIAELIDHLPGRGGSLVLSGEPGVGKSALLGEASARAHDHGMLVLTATGVVSEAQLPYAGLHQLLRPVLGQLDRLAAPQRDAILAAFGLADVAAPDLFLTALAGLDLLAETAVRVPVVVVLEDVHWLDRSSCEVLAFVARRLEFEPILLLAAIRDGYQSPLTDAGLPVLHLEPLPAAAAGALLDSRAPELPHTVRDRLLDEAAGNPLALVELPIAFHHLDRGARLPAWLPLTTRLEHAFADRVADLPTATRTTLLVAAIDDKPRLAEVLTAAALLEGAEVTIDTLAPAVAARLVELDDLEYRFRHPLMRTAIHHEASASQRHAAHAALAEVLASEPERGLWHRAASVTGPDERVARELEQAAAQARQRGATAMAVAALQRAAALSDAPLRGGRLLLAAELAFELGRQDLVLGLLKQVEPADLGPREQAWGAWIRESFADGIPGDAAQMLSLTATASRAGADGDSDLALNLLYGAALRCWWAEPGQAARDHVVAAAEGLKVDEQNPRLLVILAFAAPIGRGSAVIDRLSRLEPELGSDPGATRLIGNAAMAVGAFDLAARSLAASAAALRAQGRLGLLARALALQAWSAAQLADLGMAIPAAEEGQRLAQETNQPLVMATAQAVQAIVAALRGEQETTAAHAAQAEQVAVPIGASAVLAAAQLARGLAALGGGRPADALGHLRRIHDPNDPAYHVAIRCLTIGDLADAARRSGDPDSIRELVAEMETSAGLTPSPMLHAGLRYARALLADDADADALFETALRSDLSAWPFLRARIGLSYGEWLHQQRHDSVSRPPLRAARETFDALGIIPWSERARQQLRATGETSRPRTPEARDQLTPQELQIAQLAAEGMSNREIGQMIFLSHRTVSSHLYRAFPKLGITSRTELRRVLEPRLPHAHGTRLP
jgi:DNA-binding CsgD family transcriptional regulator